MSKPEKKRPSSPRSSPRDNAFECALRFLGYRPRSAAEVHNSLLRRGYSTAIAAAALAKLRSLTYVNDEDFARHWARAKFANRGHGPQRIARELLEPRALPSRLFGKCCVKRSLPNRITEQARGLLAKRFHHQEFTDPKTARRAIGFLQRRGYSSKVILELVKFPVEDAYVLCNVNFFIKDLPVRNLELRLKLNNIFNKQYKTRGVFGLVDGAKSSAFVMLSYKY